MIAFTPLLADAESTPDVVWSTNAHLDAVSDVAFSGDGGLLVSGARDRVAKLWSVPARELVRAFPFAINEGVLLSATVSRDGAYVGAGDDEAQARVWRVSTGQRLWISGAGNMSVQAVAFHPTTNFFARARTSGVRLQDSLTGQGLFWGDPTERGAFDVRFSPDGMYFAAGYSDNTAGLFGMATEVPAGPIPQGTNTHIRDFVGHSQRVMSVDFSPDSKLLATSAGDGTARLWNTARKPVPMWRPVKRWTRCARKTYLAMSSTRQSSSPPQYPWRRTRHAHTTDRHPDGAPQREGPYRDAWRG